MKFEDQRKDHWQDLLRNKKKACQNENDILNKSKEKLFRSKKTLKQYEKLKIRNDEILREKERKLS